MNKVVKIGLPMLLLASSSLQAAIPGFYLGAGAGYASLDSDRDLKKKDDGVLGARAFAGYNFNQYLGLEGGYTYLGKTKYYFADAPGLNLDWKMSALSLVAKGYLPLPNDRFNVYGLVGGAQMYSKLNIHDHYYSYKDSGNTIVPVVGLGATFEVDSHITAGLEFSVYGEKEGSRHSYGSPQTMLSSLYLSYTF